MDRIEYAPSTTGPNAGVWYLCEYLNIAHERLRFAERPNCLCLVHPDADNRFFQPLRDIGLWIDAIDAILHKCIPTVLKARRVETWLATTADLLRKSQIEPFVGSGELEAQLLLEAQAKAMQSQAQSQAQLLSQSQTSQTSQASQTSKTPKTLSQTTQSPQSSSSSRPYSVYSNRESVQLDMSGQMIQWDRASHVHECLMLQAQSMEAPVVAGTEDDGNSGSDQ